MGAAHPCGSGTRAVAAFASATTSPPKTPRKLFSVSERRPQPLCFCSSAPAAFPRWLPCRLSMLQHVLVPSATCKAVGRFAVQTACTLVLVNTYRPDAMTARCLTTGVGARRNRKWAENPDGWAAPLVVGEAYELSFPDALIAPESLRLEATDLRSASAGAPDESGLPPPEALWLTVAYKQARPSTGLGLHRIRPRAENRPPSFPSRLHRSGTRRSSQLCCHISQHSSPGSTFINRRAAAPGPRSCL